MLILDHFPRSPLSISVCSDKMSCERALNKDIAHQRPFTNCTITNIEEIYFLLKEVYYCSTFIFFHLAPSPPPFPSPSPHQAARTFAFGTSIFHGPLSRGDSGVCRSAEMLKTPGGIVITYKHTDSFHPREKLPCLHYLLSFCRHKIRWKTTSFNATNSIRCARVASRARDTK